MAKDLTLRLPDETAARLEATARLAGRSLGEIGVRSIEEWLRLNEFPGIEFQSFGNERQACIRGAYPVWKLIRVAHDYDLDIEKTAAHFGWPVSQLRTAFDYYAAHPDEIDGAIAENRAMTYDRLKTVLPGLERITLPPLPHEGSSSS